MYCILKVMQFLKHYSFTRWCSYLLKVWWDL